VIDTDGYRANVGIILTNKDNKVFLARRIGQDGWQFPQGGINHNENPEQAMFRELYEEVGLFPEDVKVVAQTDDWVRYDLPKRLIRNRQKPLCIGQKQRWFLLRLVSEESKIKLDLSHSPEFDSWRWVNYWHPVREVISFKRSVYKQALKELAPFLFNKMTSISRG